MLFGFFFSHWIFCPLEKSHPADKINLKVLKKKKSFSPLETRFPYDYYITISKTFRRVSTATFTAREQDLSTISGSFGKGSTAHQQPGSSWYSDIKTVQVKVARLFTSTAFHNLSCASSISQYKWSRKARLSRKGRTEISALCLVFYFNIPSPQMLRQLDLLFGWFWLTQIDGSWKKRHLKINPLRRLSEASILSFSARYLGAGLFFFFDNTWLRLGELASERALFFLHTAAARNVLNAKHLI